jgi:hypothetical protein
MIRQPEFVNADLVEVIRAMITKKKAQDLLDKVKFEEIEEEKCVQMLHVGSYDSVTCKV